MKTNKDIIYADESYEIIGMMYEVHDKIGSGHKEVFYQKAVAEIFRKNGKNFKEQLRLKVKMGGKEVGEYVLDFLYEDIIVIELKQGEVFSKSNINQIYVYLKATGLKLGLLINFTRNGVKFKRIVNIA
ncbi:MAG: GxxExxY protein [Candidatus Moranbacteria bacterium]|nr:GxxExxY protein [Candidatus Moranbacteria bacterium]